MQILRIISLIVCFSLIQIFAQPEDVEFRNLTSAEGLPSTSVTGVTQDAFGFIWIGSWDDVYRYDGRSFKIIPSSYNGRYFEADKKGGVWISFVDSVGYYDPFTDKIKKYSIPNSKRNRKLSIDDSDGVWVTSDDGIYKFNYTSDSFIKDPGQQSGYIFELTAYDEGKLFFIFRKNISGKREYFIGRRNSNGEYIYEPVPEDLNNPQAGKLFSDSNNGKIFLRRFNSTDIVIINSLGWAYKTEKKTNWIFKKSLINDFTIDAADAQIDNNGNIWLNQLNHRLCKINIKSGKTTIYKNDPGNPNSLLPLKFIILPGNHMFIDRQGILWITRFSFGISRLNLYESDFGLLKDSTGSPITDVLSALELKDGSYWIGTRNYDGLKFFSPTGKIIKAYVQEIRISPPGKSVSNQLSHPFAWSLAQSSDGSIWVGGGSPGPHIGGVSRIPPNTDLITRFKYDPNDDSSISGDFISKILVDGSDRVWIDTDGGLCYIIPESEKVTRWLKKNYYDSTSQSSDHLELVLSSGNIVIGSLESGESHIIYHKTLEIKSFGIKTFGANPIRYVHEDDKGKIWFISDEGFGYLDSSYTKIAYFYKIKNYIFPATKIVALNSDKDGMIWLATDNGIIEFDPLTAKYRHIGFLRGAQGNLFYGLVNYKGPSGKIYFAGNGGVNIIDPEAIKTNPYPPEMLFTSLNLDGELIKPGENSAINEPIFAADTIIVGPDIQTISIDFSAIHFAGYAENNYQYKLNGFDKSWRNGGTIGRATYTNLSPGEYTLFIKGSNWDNVWSDGKKSIKLIILPPFWATWWAYSLYVLCGLGLLYGLRRYELNRTQLKNQVKLDEVKLKEREQTDKMKSRFFANISHEFRTPLTLILGPSESIAAESKEEETKKKASTIKRNAKRLLGLINQLLDLSKLEAGKLELKTSKANIVSFIKGITYSFESVAERKDITLKVKSSNENIEMYFDKEKMTKIMTNLLSNAFKFTPEDGAITVSINECHSELGSESLFNKKMLKQASLPARQVQHDRCVEIKVKDTGIGISEEELPKLFDRFYQVDSSQTREHEGTGIGLALTKELVELHHGTISVESKLGGWTEFTIILLLGRNHLKDEQIVEEEKTTDEVILNPDQFGMKNLNEFNYLDSSSQTPQNDNEDKNIILIVEDNRDVREFIIDSLGKEFQIEEASNGEMGVRKAEQIIPDLIISDIMMPQMDGNELTRILKNDEKTSHIPIILLTAKSEQQSKLDGLETGADEYLTKPFDTKELRVRINNLISIRRKLQEKYSSGYYRPVTRRDEKKLSDLDERFLSKVMEVIENNLSEEEFSIEQFGKEVGMSRMQLHRKLKALTGKSPSSYLRSIRLAKAKKMIEDKKGNISEIAYSVGFSSPTYFTRCYKEEFGHLPSDLLN